MKPHLPDCPCINCGAEKLLINGSHKVFGPPNPKDGKQVWLATEYGVECPDCGHKFRVSVTVY